MAEYKILKFIRFSELEQWNVKRFFVNKISSKYPIFSLSELLQEQNKKKKLCDFPNEDFGILGVSNSEGMFDAYTEKGGNIKQPYKIVHNDYIAYNPYRVNVGSVGIKKDNLKNTYISSAYVVFSTKLKLSPDYLYLLMHTKEFNRQIKDHTTGSVRQTLSFENLCNISIPTPPLSTQEKLVKDYDSAMQKAASLEKQVQEEQNVLEEYIMQMLGIKRQQKKEKQEGLLRFMRFQDIADRWDLWNIERNSQYDLTSTTYPNIKIKDVCNFTYGKGLRADKRNGGEVPVYSSAGITGYHNKALVNSKGIIVGRKGSIGTVYYSPIPFYCIDTTYYILPNDSKYDLKYLYYIFQMLHFEKFNEDIAVPGLHLNTVYKQTIPLPPLSKQKEIVSFIEKTQQEIKQNIAELNTIKQSAQRAFLQAVFL